MIGKYINDGIARLAQHRDVLLGSGIAFGTKLASAVLSYLMFLLIARALDPDSYGQFSFAFALAITLGNFAGLGSGNSILRFLPEYHVRGERGLAKGFVRTILSAIIISSLATGAMLALFAVAGGADWLGVVPGLLIATAALIPVIAYGDALSSYVRVHGRMLLALAPRDVLWRLLVCAGVGLAILRTWQSDATFLLWMICGLYVIVLVLQSVLSSPQFKSDLSAGRTETVIPEWVKISLPLWGTVGLNAMIQQFDVVMIGLFLTPSEAGPYFAAQRTATLLLLFQLAGSLAAAPLIARLHASQNAAQVKRVTTLLALAVGLCAIMGFVAMAVIGRPLLALFDPAFVIAYPVLLILCFAYMIDAMAGPTATLLQMTGGQGVYLRIMAGMYALVVIAQIVLIPHFGLMGAAVANALGYVATSLIAAYAVKRRLGFNPTLFGGWFGQSGGSGGNVI